MAPDYDREHVLSQAKALEKISPESFAAVVADYLEHGTVSFTSRLIPEAEKEAVWGRLGVWTSQKMDGDEQFLFSLWLDMTPDSDPHKQAVVAAASRIAHKCVGVLSKGAFLDEKNQDIFIETYTGLARILSCGFGAALKSQMRDLIDPLMALDPLPLPQQFIILRLILNLDGFEKGRDRDFLEQVLARQDIKDGPLRLRLAVHYIQMKGDFDAVLPTLCASWTQYTATTALYSSFIPLMYAMDAMANIHGITKTCDAIRDRLPEEKRALFYKGLLDMHGDMAAYGRKALGLREMKPPSP